MYQKNSALTVVLSVIALFLGIGLLSGKGTTIQNSLGGSEGSPAYTKAATSTTKTIGSTTQAVNATNTARTFMQITNPGGVQVFCQLDNGKAATTGSGITIGTTSPVYVMSMANNNLYLGQVNCITSASTAVINVYER